MYTFEKIEDEFNYGEASRNHTLISHMPGANPIEGIIQLMAGAASEGAALLYAVGFEPTDHTDFSNLFTEQSSDPALVLASVAEIVRARSELSPYIMIRRPAKVPVYLFIEDLASVVRGSHEAKASLELIAREGRAVGVYFVAATERTDRLVLDKMRDSFTKQIIIEPEGSEEKPSPFENLFQAEAAKGRGSDQFAWVVPMAESPLERILGITGSGVGRPIGRDGDDEEFEGRLYPMDPMAADLRDYEGSPLFEKLEHADTIQLPKILDAIYQRIKRARH